ISMFFGGTALAQVTCIETYMAGSDRQSLGFAPSDVEGLVFEIAESIGLSSSGIKVIPCDGVGKARANYYNEKGISVGDYIFYEPVWVREVIGNRLVGDEQKKARDQAIVLFGHELGHLLDRHWTSNVALSTLQKEQAADHFAGCAAGV